MEPETREGLFMIVRENASLSDYATHLALNKPLNLYIVHANDGYLEYRGLEIRSIERREYPNPHLIKGILEFDLNRRGEDASDFPAHAEVVVEMWSYPCTHVYLESGYDNAKFACIENIPTDTYFRICENGADDSSILYKKLNNNLVKVTATGETKNFRNKGSTVAQIMPEDDPW